jgi:hypothetical protein
MAMVEDAGQGGLLIHHLLQGNEEGHHCWLCPGALQAARQLGICWQH